MPLAMAERIVDDLARLGTRRVVLTGGEPMLHPGWRGIARRLADCGVTVRLFTGGAALDDEALDAARDAGIAEFAVSLDGPAAVHDRLRPLEGRSPGSSFARATAAIGRLVARGAAVRAVTAVSRLNAGALEATYALVRDLGVARWQVHLVQMTGRARDHRELLAPSPADLEEIVRVLLVAARERRVVAPLHCTVGYMTQEEPVLRSREIAGEPVWAGCGAGLRAFAINADGGVKGCTALDDEFVTASLVTRTLAEIWADDACFPYARAWSAELLAGACARCRLAARCRAGCPAVAYGATGAIGANPYCLRLVRR
jgi:radical SAM protein with 4Fe4S-binding SPASM domain